MIEDQVPDKYKDQMDMAKSLYASEDRRATLTGFVPDKYQGQLQTAMTTYDKAKDFKKQKDEMQISLFEKVIEPFWKQFDPTNLGYIGQDKFMQLGQLALEKAGHGDKFDEQVFEKAIQVMVQTNADPASELTLKKRSVAEILNQIVFQGL